jgi:cysteine synthase B
LDGKVLLDATSGNTGIAYAMLGASLGVPVSLTLPSNASEERKAILASYGATIHFTSPLEGTDGAQGEVKNLMEAHPGKYYCPDQYNNENNWKAHFSTTGPEIWSQTKGDVTHFLAGLGTTGTFVGTSRFLKEKGVTCWSVQPDSPMHGLEGWKHLETALVPGIYDADVADEQTVVSTESAFQMAIAASKFLGLHISPSAGANLASSLNLVKNISSGVVVTIFPDNALKYLREPFWSDHDYLIENPFRRN